MIFLFIILINIRPIWLQNITKPPTINPFRDIKCGRQFLDNHKIVGGSEAKFGEFPWMALIFYAKFNRNDCGGTIIHTKYILTAAHCITGSAIHINGKPTKVRLGEHDLTTNPDCVKENSGFCAAPTIDMDIQSLMPNSKYSTYSRDLAYDVGLIKLISDIVFTDFIQPICLSTNSIMPSEGTKLYVAGWGRTESASSSNVKLKATVPLYNGTLCQQIYKYRQVKDDQICAGGEDGIDTCRGDSGGPLMLYQKNWIIYGIVSSGPSVCGRPNYPAVYTKVGYYNNWIVRRILNS